MYRQPDYELPYQIETRILLVGHHGQLRKSRVFRVKISWIGATAVCRVASL
jgi:hypothetical protein